MPNNQQEQDPGSDRKYGHTELTFNALAKTGFFTRIGCSAWELAELADDYYRHIDIWLTSRKTDAKVGTSLRWQETYSDMGTFTVRNTEYDAWQNGRLGCKYWIHCYDQHIDGTPLVAHTASTATMLPKCNPTRWFYSTKATQIKANRYVWTGQTWLSKTGV